ncbi:MAG: hypothetical protein ACO3JJ_09905 [Opitutaceae bacterium]
MIPDPGPTPPCPAAAPRALWLALLGIAAWAPLPAQDEAARDFSRPDRGYVQRVPIFFPPTPPPLGRALPPAPPAEGRLAAPVELAAHANEPFYPQLATRLATKSLPTRLRERVDAYRARKAALTEELRVELARAQALPAAERGAALGDLARRQREPLRALEVEAEELRRDLQVGDNTWGALRQWRLSNDERRGFSPIEIAQVMRSYAFYQNGLLPAQRRLLREIALELQAAGETAESAAVNQPYLFFPPEPARVLPPEDLPPEVATRLAAYQARKAALKKELFDAVYAHDGQAFPWLRGNTMGALARRQEVALAELEQLAEEIRLGLAGNPEPAPLAERTPLPPVLQERVAALLRDVALTQQSAGARIEALLAGARDLPVQTNYRFDPEGIRFVVVPLRNERGAKPAAPDTPARISALRESISAVAEDYGRRLAGFINERDAIRAEAGALLQLGRADRLDQALQTAMRVANARETQEVYRDYRTALFAPGLSPEQRRLLFDHVIVRLELPLPRGELQPVNRQPTW